ncbi:MAG TPA: hypothetical protein VMW18_17495 [Candidatus Binatia bacterium]|nr:hypothetical protein [Candidatus Binatia bacterium]
MSIQVRRLAIAAALTFVSSPIWSTAVLATPVTLNAVATPGGAVLSEPVTWQVQSIDKKGALVPTPVAAGTAPILKTDLKPGQYLITAKRGTISIQQGLMVGRSDEVRNIVVSAANPVMQAKSGTANAAAPVVAATGAPATVSVAPKAAAAAPTTGLAANSKLVIGMIPNTGRGPITEPIDWQLYTYSKGQTENGYLVAHKNSPSATFMLPAGSYVIRAGYRGTQADLVIPVAANQSYTYTINLYAGEAKLTAVKPTGPAREAVVWQIVREKPGPDGKYELVTASNDASPQLLVREGKYLVVARLGDMWGVQPLSVSAGRVTAARVKLQRGEGAPIVVASAN